jgi:hypothetical protein
MYSFKDADEQKLFMAIHAFLKNYPKLLEFVFDPQKPRLRRDPEELLREGRGLSSGEYLLIKIALDLWNASGNTRIHELIETLDPGNFERVMKSLMSLGPKW